MVVPDPTKVAGLTARGMARADRQREQQSPFDVWTNTGAGIAAEHEAFFSDPVGALENARAGRALQDAAMNDVSQWESASLSEAWDATTASLSDVGDAVNKIGDADGALATTGAVFATMTALEQTVSMMFSAIPFPAFPAVRVMDTAIGLPHAHAHPPNLVPPAPPAPFPSAGPVIPIPYVSGAATVLINNMPAGRCGDMGMGIWCGGYFPMYEIFLGSSSVWLEGARAARVAVDITKHCIFTTPKPQDPPIGPMVGTTVCSSPNVLIGGIPMPSLTSAAVGAAFKAVFRGLGKLKSMARAADDVAEEAGEAAGRAGRNADEAAEMAELRSPRGNDRIAPSRTPDLPTQASMEDMLSMRAVPGRQGVVLTDVVDDTAELYADIYRLSRENGIEYVLTRENGNLVLRSGSAVTCPVPVGVHPIAHTHPPDELGNIQPQPSRADVNLMNNLWDRNPNGPRPQSDIIWGEGPNDVTRFGATGLDPIPDPTRGGLKPKRRWN